VRERLRYSVDDGLGFRQIVQNRLPINWVELVWILGLMPGDADPGRLDASWNSSTR
jgi:hypothetical protein